MSSSGTTKPQVPVGTGLLELEIGGMTCASCAARIEKRLNKLDGVTATVNYSTEKARVAFPDTVTADDLVAAVRGLVATGRVAAIGLAATWRHRSPARPEHAAVVRGLLAAAG